MHGGMISSNALVVIATLLVLVSALIPSAAAAMIMGYETAVIKLSSLIHSQGSVALAFLSIGPLLIVGLSSIVVSRLFKRS